MISYFGPFDSRFGRATFLGQDAVIVPVPAAPARTPDPEPAGPQAAPAVAPATGAPEGPTISIGGRQVSVVALALAGAISLGAIALVVSTTSSMNRR
jgi:hypothetical protein